VNVEPTPLDGVVVLEPDVFADERGSFYEAYSTEVFATATGFGGEFVQDNQSTSIRGVLRGLHYQVPPHAQGKLVRCVVGDVFDVAVDIRRSSPAFGRWTGTALSGTNHRQLWVPPGFAHGFLAMTDGATVLYKTTAGYARRAERSIRWDDPTIGIEWPDLGVEPILNDRDQTAPLLDQAEVFP
jgi:dTDP-4-dehydrorhamnose 3,5-epimerase